MSIHDMVTADAILYRRHVTPRKAVIEFETVPQAVLMAKTHGGRVAVELGIDVPTAMWFSTAWSMTEIMLFKPAGGHLQIGPWTEFA